MDAAADAAFECGIQDGVAVGGKDANAGEGLNFLQQDIDFADLPTADGGGEPCLAECCQLKCLTI